MHQIKKGPGHPVKVNNMDMKRMEAKDYKKEIEKAQERIKWVHHMEELQTIKEHAESELPEGYKVVNVAIIGEVTNIVSGFDREGNTFEAVEVSNALGSWYEVIKFERVM